MYLWPAFLSVKPAAHRQRAGVDLDFAHQSADVKVTNGISRDGRFAVDSVPVRVSGHRGQRQGQRRPGAGRQAGAGTRADAGPACAAGTPRANRPPPDPVPEIIQIVASPPPPPLAEEAETVNPAPLSARCAACRLARPTASLAACHQKMAVHRQSGGCRAGADVQRQVKKNGMPSRARPERLPICEDAAASPCCARTGTARQAVTVRTMLRSWFCGAMRRRQAGPDPSVRCWLVLERLR